MPTLLRFLVHAPMPGARGRRLTALVAAVGVSLLLQSRGTVRGAEEGAASTTRGAALYQQHCAACHGDLGDGQGLAAVFLYPKPRDFRAGRFRMISTPNSVPTREDLLGVLRRGMPGSSMPPWSHLPQDELEALVDEVIRLRKNGAREFYAAMLRDEEELTDEEMAEPDVVNEIDEYVDRMTTPQLAVEVPTDVASTPDAIQRGQGLYRQLGCVACHGETGRGDGVQVMVDDEKYPTQPRDFTQGVFKGGDDLSSLYRRIALGMPGTPMPSSAATSISMEQTLDLVHYVRSLSTEAQRKSCVLSRRKLVGTRVSRTPLTPEHPLWRDVPSEQLEVMPLWWDGRSEPKLRIQVVHDGQRIALRLDWEDPTADEQVERPEAFADMAAIQWCQAGQEPFLGMGSSGVPVELWHWRAGDGRAEATESPLDEYPFDSTVEKSRDDLARHNPFFTAGVAGNPLASGRRFSASLAARGPGSTTFRPRSSQTVRARSVRDGRNWSVVFHRSLVPQGPGDLTLQPGKNYSLACALWDGDRRDRASQKVITIWHDLQLR